MNLKENQTPGDMLHTASLLHQAAIHHQTIKDSKQSAKRQQLSHSMIFLSNLLLTIAQAPYM